MNQGIHQTQQLVTGTENSPEPSFLGGLGLALTKGRAPPGGPSPSSEFNVENQPRFSPLCSDPRVPGHTFSSFRWQLTGAERGPRKFTEPGVLGMRLTPEGH